MGRLFWKIFLWFWVAMLLMGLAIAWGVSTVIDNSDLDPRQRQHKYMLLTRVETLAQVVAFNGEDAARDFLMRSQMRAVGIRPHRRPHRAEPSRMPRRPPITIQTYVVNNAGIDILQRPLPDWIDKSSINHKSPDTYRGQWPPTNVVIDNSSAYSLTRSIQSNEGQSYTIFARLQLPKKPAVDFQRIVPFGLGRIYERQPQLTQIRIVMAVLLSSLFCFGLSWYLVKPMKLLSTASKKIAQGQLETRVANAIGHRGDELESLAIDFDFMAERIQTLVSTQQNLLNDVSHELRSPLARLQVAVGLAQQKNTNNISDELQRIELETTRINDLLSQVLTLARLDNGVIDQHNDYVDLSALLEQIAIDANFEATVDNKRVLVQSSTRCSIQANLGLLHRALENIVRNALKYTANDSTVTIRLKQQERPTAQIMIQICDSGEGVPESFLPRLFEPFFRVASARDRNSGGYGLGLAIAQRAIKAHKGTIKAHNRLEGGLCVTIELPFDTVIPNDALNPTQGT
jgi:two-component system sensor histidine kinase CpxA